MSYHYYQKSSKDHRDFSRVLTTGVQRRDPETYSAVINLANLDPKMTQRVTVEVWDWSSYVNPVKLPVLIDDLDIVRFPYKIAPENLAVMYTFLQPENVVFYEVRIIQHSGNENLVVNTYGNRIDLTNPLENRVLQSQLVPLQIKNGC